MRRKLVRKEVGSSAVLIMEKASRKTYQFWHHKKRSRETERGTCSHSVSKRLISFVLNFLGLTHPNTTTQHYCFFFGCIPRDPRWSRGENPVTPEQTRRSKTRSCHINTVFPSVFKCYHPTVVKEKYSFFTVRLHKMWGEGGWNKG